MFSFLSGGLVLVARVLAARPAQAFFNRIALALEERVDRVWSKLSVGARNAAALLVVFGGIAILVAMVRSGAVGPEFLPPYVQDQVPRAGAGRAAVSLPDGSIRTGLVEVQRTGDDTFVLSFKAPTSEGRAVSKPEGRL